METVEIIMNIKELIPALLLAAVGLALTVWSVFIILSNPNASILNLKGPIILAVAGILLVAFAIFYVKNVDHQYKEEDEDEFKDELGIIWEENEDESEDDNEEVNEEVNEEKNGDK